MTSLQSTIETMIGYTVFLTGLAHFIAIIFVGPIAYEKGRSTIQGVMLALCFGPLGLLILACLPTRPRTDATPPLPPGRRNDDAAAAFTAAAASESQATYGAAADAAADAAERRAAEAAHAAAPRPRAARTSVPPPTPWTPPSVGDDALPARRAAYATKGGV